LTLAHARGDGRTARGGGDERGAGRDGYDPDTQRESDGNGMDAIQTRLRRDDNVRSDGNDTQSPPDPRDESSRVGEPERRSGVHTMQTTLSAQLVFRLWLPCVVRDSALRGVGGRDAGGEGGKMGGVGGQRRGGGGERGGVENLACARESRMHRGVQGVGFDANGQRGRHVCGEVLTVSEVLRYIYKFVYV
jgi:hypothetical protein